MSGSRPQLENHPELMQLIQLRLPVKEAACTSVLSKSWLHAWSTIPTLRFCIRNKNMLVDIDRTLTRYLRDNIPIERFDLDINIEDQESASLAEKCIRSLATNKNSTTLRELSLMYHLYNAPSSNFPHGILSCENLTKIAVINDWRSTYTSRWMTRPHHPVIINCVSLRELYLIKVNISQKLFDSILSSCRLLVKIELIYSSWYLNNIKVTNLPCLSHLERDTGRRGPISLEINHVPNLHVFTWGRSTHDPFIAHSISLGSSLKELSLGNMVTSDASLDMIISGAPFIESLTLDMENWELGSFHFACASIKRLSLICFRSKLTDVKVYASNLLFLSLDGDTMPNLLFPVSTLIQQTTFQLDLNIHVDASFFLKMREALALSSNCNFLIYSHGRLSSNIDIDDLRTRLPFPHAMKVQQLSFQMWERSPFIDALFEICHPNYVTALQDHDESATKNQFCKVMLTEVLEKKMTTPMYWLRYLKHVQLSCHKKWETLTDTHRSFLDSPTSSEVDFKLEWL